MSVKWPTGRAADMQAAIKAQRPGDRFTNDDGEECLVILAYGVKGDQCLHWCEALGISWVDGDAKWKNAPQR